MLPGLESALRPGNPLCLSVSTGLCALGAPKQRKPKLRVSTLSSTASTLSRSCNDRVTLLQVPKSGALQAASSRMPRQRAAALVSKRTAGAEGYASSAHVWRRGAAAHAFSPSRLKWQCMGSEERMRGADGGRLIRPSRPRC